MRKQVVLALFVVISSAIVHASLGRDEHAYAQRGMGVLEIHVTSHRCPTCATPVDDAQRPVEGARVRLVRTASVRRVIARGTTNANGVVSFRLSEASYCAELEGRAGSVAAVANEHLCTAVRVGQTARLSIDASPCEPLHCTGREP